MTYAASFTMNDSDDLSGIAVDGTAVNGFTADNLAYEAAGSTVTANTTVNAGITILPAYEGVVRILTVSEDGTNDKVYEITTGGKAPCSHENTAVRDASPATCIAEGYTGDTWCTDCGTKISTGTVIAAKGHKWDNGEITQQPTESEDGIRTFTCTACGATRTETVVYQPTLKAPSVSLKLSTNNSGRIVITGQIDDFANLDEYYEITGRGLLYIQTSRIGTRTLTVNTSGRTRVNFSTVSEEGTFTYNLKPSSKSTSYAFRAFVIYKNTVTGKTVTVYSDVIRSSYNGINK